MKFHTSVSDIIISLFILIGVCASMFMLAQHALLPDIFKPKERLVALDLSEAGSVRLDIGSVDRTIFDSLIARDISFTIGDEREPSIVADSLRLGISIGSLLFARTGNASLPVYIDRPNISLNEAVLGLLDTPTQGPSVSLPNRYGLDISVSRGSVAGNLEDMNLSVLEINGRFNLTKDFEPTEAALSFSQGSFEQSDVSVGTSDVEVRLENDDADRISVVFTASNTQAQMAEHSSGFSIKELQATFESASLQQIATGTGTLRLDGTDLAVSVGNDLYASETVLDALSIDAELFEAEPISVSGRIQSFSSHISYTTLLDAQLEISLFRLGILKAVDGYSAFLTTESPMILQSGDRTPIQIDGARFEGTVGTSFSTARINWQSLVVADVSILEPIVDASTIALFEDGRADNSYVSATFDHENDVLHGEFTTSLGLSLTYPYLERIETDLFGMFTVSLDQKSWNGEATAENMKILGFPGTMSIRTNASGQSDSFNLVDVSARHSEGLALGASYNPLRDEIRAQLQLENVRPIIFSNFLARVVDRLPAVFNDNTVIGGNISALVSDEVSTGTVHAELGVSQLVIDQNAVNFASTVSAAFSKEEIEVESATLTTETARFEFRGSLDRKTFFPRGALNYQNPETGQMLLSVDFFHILDLSYGYAFSSPLVPSVTLDGVVDFQSARVLRANASLAVADETYPLGIRADFEAGTVDIDTSGLMLDISFTSLPGRINASMELDRFRLPAIGLGNPLLSGRASAEYAIVDSNFNVSFDKLSIDGLAWHERGAWNATVGIDITPKNITIDVFDYTDPWGSLSGMVSLESQSLSHLANGDLRGFRTAGTLKSRDSGSEELTVSMYADTTQPLPLRGLVSVKDFPLGRVTGTLDDFVLSLSSIGASTHSFDLMEVDAELSLESTPEESIIANAGISINQDGLTVPAFTAQINGVSIERGSAAFLFDGTGMVDFDVNIPASNIWRDNTTRASAAIRSSFGPYPSLPEMISGIAQEIETGIEAVFSFTDVVLFGDIALDDIAFDLSYTKDEISIHGISMPSLSAFFRFSDQSFSASVPEEFPISFNIAGFVTDQYISVALDSVSFPLTWLNPLFPYPLFLFSSGIGHGNLFIEGPLDDPDYYGTAFGEKVEATVFYTPTETLSLKNPVITISENSATMGKTPVVSIRDDGTITHGYFSLDFGVEKWNLPTFSISLLIPETPVPLWIPIPLSSINLEAMVMGSLHYQGDASGQYLRGDLLVDSGSFSFKVPEVPEWMLLPQGVTTDISVTTGKNVTFAYPDLDSPIVNAVFDDNQNMRFVYDHISQNMSFEGALAFRSGEIYYVQKNFYVTEGALTFKTGMTQADIIDATIDLRARVREFDSEGDKVDIYLVLENSTLDNIVPRFESSPMLSTNEILEILGQGILGGLRFEENAFSSVVALASVATDMISRLGLIDTTVATSFGFSTLIRESLGLDVFSIRSNLLQNILFDALPGRSDTISLSPMAKYLDKTTLYIGKYLVDDLYMQGMVNLRATANPSTTMFSFLANDMEIDTELSLEWITPLATFSIFTKPEELSVFNLLDTIGFSVTKRFVF